MSECYEIPDPKYYNGEFGTIQQPHLYKITFGRKFKNSLNFHCKIGPDFFIYRVRCINRKTLNLDCAEHQNSKTPHPPPNSPEEHAMHTFAHVMVKVVGSLSHLTAI